MRPRERDHLLGREVFQGDDPGENGRIRPLRDVQSDDDLIVRRLDEIRAERERDGDGVTPLAMQLTNQRFQPETAPGG